MGVDGFFAGCHSPRRVCSGYAFSINGMRLGTPSVRLLASQSITMPWQHFSLATRQWHPAGCIKVVETGESHMPQVSLNDAEKPSITLEKVLI